MAAARTPGDVMSEEEVDDDGDLELDDADIAEDELEDDALVEADDDVDVLDLDDPLVEPLVEGEVVPDPLTEAVVGAPVPVAAPEEDEDVLELDEELHPDDVEAPLDALLQEKTAAATMEDDEEELEEEEPDVDDRGEGPAKIVPRRPG